MTVELWAYAGAPPTCEQIEAAFGLRTAPYTYMVATTGQEDLRRTLAPAAQLDERSPLGVALVFHKAVRSLMATPVLSRTDERVLLRRTMEHVAGNDTERALRLRHDASTWTEVLAELDERGLDLTDPTAAATHAGTWAHPALGTLLADLQHARRRPEFTEPAGDHVGFEAAARAWLLGRPTLGEVVVLDGFTRLTDLQRLLIQTASETARVVLLFPYRPDTRAFAAIERTYAAWWGDGPSMMPTEHASTPSVDVRAYRSRHEEVAACIALIAELRGRGVPAKEIAVVTPYREEYDGLLQEEARLQELDVHIGVPPRLLLLTPLGRFVLTLYEVWADDDLAMDADRFEALLASGWLGAPAQRSAAEFRLVKGQLFARLRGGDEWAAALEATATRVPRHEPGSRIPSNWLQAAEVQRWRQAVEQLRTLTRRLFDDNSGSIGDHVRRLLEGLSELPSAQRFDAEQEILERLIAALAEAADATSVELTTEEFGDVLVALAREREEAARTEEEALDSKHIWVTTPEGIDGVQRDTVIVLGAVDDAIPRPYQEPWPYADDRRDEHVERERYQFEAVTRSARTQLVVSYPTHTDRGPTGASPFVLRLGTPAPVEPREPGTPATQAPAVAIRARRAEYSLAELAQYAVCPLRYALEALDRRSRRFRNEFHLKLLAQAHWLDLILTWAEGQPGRVQGAQVLQRLEAARDATEDEARAAFAGLRSLVWREVREWLDAKLRGIADQADRFWVDFVPAPAAEFDVTVAGNPVTVHASGRHAMRKGKFTKVIVDDVALEEWTYPPSPDDERHPPLVGLDGAVGFPTRYAAFLWWQESMRSATTHVGLGRGVPDREAAMQEDYEARKPTMATMIEHIEAGAFPKRPGDHCRYCPVHDECLGVEP